MIEDALHSFVTELEVNVYEGARGLRRQRRQISTAVAPPRIVLTNTSNNNTNAVDGLRLGLSIGRDGVHISESSLHSNRAARVALADRDEDLGNLRRIAKRLRSACVNRGTLMKAIEDAIYARSPNLRALLASMQEDHELYRLRAEVAQRAFVETANTRLGINEQISLF